MSFRAGNTRNMSIHLSGKGKSSSKPVFSGMLIFGCLIPQEVFGVLEDVFFLYIVSVIIVAEGSGRIAKGLNHDMAFIYSGEHPLSRLRLIPVDTVGYIYIAFCSFYF